MRGATRPPRRDHGTPDHRECPPGTGLRSPRRWCVLAMRRDTRPAYGVDRRHRYGRVDLGNYDHRMSATLVARNLAGGHAHRTLFESLDLTVAPGDVVGVVGANGAGKSTLLRLLAGDLAPLEGVVSAAPGDAFVGWLPQEHERVAGETVAHYVARRTGVAAATVAMERAAEALGAGDESRAAEDAYGTALDHWQASGAPDLDERLPAVLADLGLDVDPDALMTSLSGGQAARAALAALLLSRFDVVLLDEPTNDLDLAGLERLEGFVRGLRGRRRPRLARPRVPLARRHPHRRARPRPAPGGGLRRRLRRLPRRAGRGEAARPRGVRGVRRQEGRPRLPRPDPARVELAGRAQRDEEVARQRQDPAQGAGRVVGEAGPEGPPDGVADRAPRGGRGAAQGVGAALHHRQRPAVELGRRDPRRGDGRPRVLHLRAGVAPGERRRPDRRHRTERRRQDDPAPPPRRPARALHGTGGARRLGRRRRDRPGPHRAGRGPAAGRRVRGRGARADPRRGAHAPREVRPAGRPGRPASSAGSRRGSAPVPRWRCSSPAGSTSSSSTSRRTTSTSRRSSSSRRPSTPTTGRCSSSPTTGACSRRVRLDQRWHVEDGRVTTG